MTEQLKDTISARQMEITTATRMTHAQKAEVEFQLRYLNIRTDAEDPESPNMQSQLEEERRVLDASRRLLDQLLSKIQEAAAVQPAAVTNDHSTHTVFNAQNHGIQIGTNTAPISGITFGGR